MGNGRAGKKSKAGTRRRGRPPLPGGRAKRASFNTRLRDQTKERLEQAAAAAGRSLSEEIEARLERTLEDERSAGGAHLQALFRLLSGAAGIIEARKNARFLDDYETYLAVSAAWEKILDTMRPRTIGGLSHWLPDVELDVPDPPSPPKHPGNLANLGIAGLDELIKFETAQADWHAAFLDWEKKNNHRLARVRELSAHFRKLKDLGADVAAALLDSIHKPEQ